MRLDLIDGHLASTTFTLFTGKVRIFFRFFDLVHSCSIREVLDLSRRDAFLFLLFFDGLVHCDVLLNTELLQVFLKLDESRLLLFMGRNKFFIQLVSPDVHLAVLKILNLPDAISAFVLIDLPIPGALSLPLFHESLILI